MVSNQPISLKDLAALPIVVVGDKATVATLVNDKTGNINTLPIFLDFDGNEEDFRINLYQALKNYKGDAISHKLTYQHDNYTEFINVSPEMYRAYEDIIIRQAIETSPLIKDNIAEAVTPVVEHKPLHEMVVTDKYEKYLKNILYVLGISMLLGIGIYALLWVLEN